MGHASSIKGVGLGSRPLRQVPHLTCMHLAANSSNAHEDQPLADQTLCIAGKRLR